MSEPKPFLFAEAFRSEIKEILREVIREELSANSIGTRRDDDDGLVDVDSAAEYLSVSKSWLYKNADRLPFAKKVGGARRFDKHEMRRWLEARTRR
jgi:excisionase family DNA binding protein